MAKHRKELVLQNNLIGSQPNILSEEVSVRFLEKKVRFSLRDCNMKKFCIRKLMDNEIARFYDRLGHFEELTWRQVIQLPREKGFSVEKKEDQNYALLSGIYSHFSQFYHFRVNGVQTPFRVFGAQKDDLCYILLIDKDGSINHS